MRQELTGIAIGLGILLALAAFGYGFTALVGPGPLSEAAGDFR